MGGRHGADPAHSVAHAQSLLATVPGEQTVTASTTTLGGRDAIRVEIDAELPVLGPYGIPGALHVDASGYVESIEAVEP